MSGIDTGFDRLARALDVAALRHEVIANNIANANTPGYKRKVVEFQKELARACDSPGPVGINIIEAGDPPGKDGNNVRFEGELALLQKNALYYNMLAQFADSRVKGLRAAISGNNE